MNLTRKDLQWLEDKNPVIDYSGKFGNRIGIVDIIKAIYFSDLVKSFSINMLWSIQIYEHPPMVSAGIERAWTPFRGSLKQAHSVAFTNPRQIIYQDNGLTIQCDEGIVRLTTDPHEKDFAESFKCHYEEIMVHH